MPLHYIIDGYNIINHPRVTRTFKTSIDPRLYLLSFIKTKRLTGSPKNKATLVFDGYPASYSSDYNDAEINIIFARKISADEKIKMLVEESGNRKNIVVVSDDKDIKFFAKSSGAKPMGVEEFIGCKKQDNSEKERDLVKPKLNYSQVEQINQELKALWLKD